MPAVRALVFAVLPLTACSTVPDQRHVASPWVGAFAAPAQVATSRVRLEPLRPEVNELDWRAAQSSIEHLRTTLQWGSWPSPEMTADENRADLERHWREFQNREAYAYTVLDPSGARCLGCVYLNPIEGEPRGLRMAYWVTRDQLAGALDEHLVATVLDMIANGWPVDVVTITHPAQNARGIRLLEARGLAKVDEQGGRTTFAWRR